MGATKHRFLQQLLAPKLRAITPGTLHRSLEKPSEPLSASTVWGTLHIFLALLAQKIMEPIGDLIQLSRELRLTLHPSLPQYLTELNLIRHLVTLEDRRLWVH